MASSYTSRTRLDKMARGDDIDFWDTALNLNFDLIDSAIAGREAIATTGGTTTLSSANGSADQARMAILDVSGVLVSNATITCPDSVSKWYIIKNGTTGAFTVTIKTVSGTGVTVTQGTTKMVWSDGTNVADVLSGAATLDVTDSGFTISDNSDSTKKIAFQASGITTGTTRTLTVPDASDTLVTLASTQTLTTKTIALGSNTVSGTTAQFNAALSDNDFATLAGTETLTGKTLTGNIAVNLVSGAATVTLPTTTGTLATLANAETLTNKTIALGSNTVSGTKTQFDTAVTDDNFAYLATAQSFTALQTLAAGADMTPATTPSTTAVGFLGIPQNAQNAAYTLVMADAGKHIFHDEVTARTYTIPANSAVAFPIGTAITIVNNNGAGVITLAITTDTLRRGDGTAGTGSRTIAADSIVTLLKISATVWILGGTYT